MVESFERKPSPPKKPAHAVVAAWVENHRRFLAFLERRVERRAVAEKILQEAFVPGLEQAGVPRRGTRRGPVLSPHCPMHPEIVRDAPGRCLVCGMAIEPRVATVEEGPSEENLDRRRRFSISVPLALGTLVLVMGDAFLPRPRCGLKLVTME